MYCVISTTWKTAGSLAQLRLISLGPRWAQSEMAAAIVACCLPPWEQASEGYCAFRAFCVDGAYADKMVIDD